MPEITISVTYLQKQWLHFLASRGGVALYRFGVNESDLAEGKSEEERQARRRAKELMDNEIRDMASLSKGLIVITELLIPDPEGRKHTCQMTDIGRTIYGIITSRG